MSAFLGGLLAGGAQALTTIGTAMFSDAIDQRKQERLQAIRDKEYDRARKDQLADIASQREFQKGLLTEQRKYDDQVRNTEFGQQVALQTLGEGVQKRLLAEAQKYPQSPLGKLLQDRNNASDPDEIAAINRQIAMSQLITTTDPLGAVTYATAEFGENNEIKSLTELGTFGGLGGMGNRSSGSGLSTGSSSSTEANVLPQPPISKLDAPTIEGAINQLEQALETGQLRGLTEPQIEAKLRELRQALQRLNSQAANPGFGAFNESFARR